MEKDRSTRSFQPIVRADLERLLELARADRADFFARCPDWARLYADRVLCTALCQGAALHYVDGTTGINDFDVYTFYAAHPDRAWYAKRIQAVDFGDAKFGRSQVTKSEFVGRRVDLMGRSLPVRPGTDPVQAVQNYLRQLKTETACELAAKAVVILEPRELTGVVAWPAGARPPA